MSVISFWPCDLKWNLAKHAFQNNSKQKDTSGRFVILKTMVMAVLYCTDSNI